MIVEEACWERGCACYDFRVDKGVEVARKEWVGLTDMEKFEIQNLKWWDWEDTFDLDGYTRAIEAKLKEKNT